MMVTKLCIGLAVAFGVLAVVVYFAAPKFNPNENTTRELYMLGVGCSTVAAAGFGIAAVVRRRKGS
jgi:hypothetical protein